MSQDLLTQLAEYGAYCDERQGSVTPDDVIGGVVPIPAPVSPARPRRGWLVAVAAAAVVLLVVGGVALLPRVSGTDSPVATTPPTDPVSSPTWSRVPHDEAVFGGAHSPIMRSVTVGGPGLVAVGADGSESDRDAAVWTSPDGITWSRVPHDETVFGGEGPQWMGSVTVGGPGLVAVGTDGNEAVDDGDAAVWTSPDGITWSRVPHDESVFGGERAQQMWSVTAGGPGLVAVGWDASRYIDGSPRVGDAAVWTSPDGITWSRVPHDEAVFGGDGAPVMMSVTAGGPGLVAVGAEGSGAFGRNAAVWTSPDGITWSRVPHDETVFGGTDRSDQNRRWMNGVTAGGPGLVAVGTDGTGAMVWTSVDGITWSRVPYDEAVFGSRVSHDEAVSGRVGLGPRWMSSVTVGGPGLVAVGAADDLNDAAVWTSPDGITWSRVPDDEAVFGGTDRSDLNGQWMNGVTAGGPGLVAVGADGTGVAYRPGQWSSRGDDFDAAVWTWGN